MRECSIAIYMYIYIYIDITPSNANKKTQGINDVKYYWVSNTWGY